MQSSLYVFVLTCLFGALMFVGCEGGKSSDVNTSELLLSKLSQIKGNKEAAKIALDKIENHPRNNWIGKFDYLCLSYGYNGCDTKGCVDGGNFENYFVLVKNRADSFSSIGMFVSLNEKNSDQIIQYCGEDLVDLYSYSTCASFDGNCLTQFDFFHKKQFSESLVFTDNNSSGHVIRINTETGKYIQMEAVGAVGTNINFSYGQCYSYEDILAF